MSRTSKKKRVRRKTEDVVVISDPRPVAFVSSDRSPEEELVQRAERAERKLEEAQRKIQSLEAKLKSARDLVGLLTKAADRANAFLEEMDKRQ